MPTSKQPKTRRVKKTDEQKEAGKKILEFLNKNDLKDGDEISLAINRLACLNFNGGNEHTLNTVYEKLPIAFDKYLEHGFKLTEKEKKLLIKNKDKIISLIKPFYWVEGDNVAGMNFKKYLPDYIDGFTGIFNLNNDDFVI